MGRSVFLFQQLIFHFLQHLIGLLLDKHIHKPQWYRSLRVGIARGRNLDFIWSAISKGAIGAVILIDHHSDNPIQELESYLETFQNFTDNIAIGITHTDLLSESTKSTTIYKDWLLQNDLFSPLFFIDARKKDDVLLLLEALITSIEINSNIAN